MKDSKDCHMKILDGIFSVAVVGSLVVLVWRGSFLYLDILMFPTNEVHSAWGSTVSQLTIPFNKHQSTNNTSLIGLGIFNRFVWLHATVTIGRFLC